MEPVELNKPLQTQPVEPDDPFQSLKKWWNPAAGAALRSFREKKAHPRELRKQNRFYSVVANDSRGDQISAKTGRRWESGETGIDPILFRCVCDYYAIDIRDLWRHANGLADDSAPDLPHVKLFDYLRAELAETNQFEVIGPPGMWHLETCWAAAECLKRQFPRRRKIDVAHVKDTDGIWREFAKAAGVDFENGSANRLPEKIAQAGDLFVVTGLDNACANLLDRAIENAYEIQGWLNAFTNSQIPAIFCGTFQVRGMISLIYPRMRGSTRTPQLLKFPEYGYCDAWDDWLDHYFSKYPHLNASEREDLRRHAGQNPEAVRTGLKGTRRLTDRLAAIDRIHDDFARRIIGLIPQDHLSDFISVAIPPKPPTQKREGTEREGRIRELLRDAGILRDPIADGGKEPYRARWEAIWIAEAKQAGATSKGKAS